MLIVRCSRFSIEVAHQTAQYSRSSRKRTPSGRDKNVRNWSLREWFSKAATRGVGDRWPLTGACPANNKYWYTKKYCGIKQTLKYGTVITVKSFVTNGNVKWLIDKNKILYRGC